MGRQDSWYSYVGVKHRQTGWTSLWPVMNQDGLWSRVSGVIWRRYSGAKESLFGELVRGGISMCKSDTEPRLQEDGEIRVGSRRSAALLEGVSLGPCTIGAQNGGKSEWEFCIWSRKCPRHSGDLDLEHIVFAGTCRRRKGRSRSSRVGHGGSSRRGHVQCPRGVEIQVKGEMMSLRFGGGVEGTKGEQIDVQRGIEVLRR